MKKAALSALLFLPRLASGAEPISAALVNVDVRTTYVETAPASMAPQDKLPAGLILDYLVKQEEITGFKDYSLRFTEFKGAPVVNGDPAKTVRFPAEATRVAANRTCGRFTLMIPSASALTLSRTLGFRGEVIAFGKGQTEATAAIPLPAVGAPPVQLGRFTVSRLAPPSRTDNALLLTVEGFPNRFNGLLIKADDVEVKEERRERMGDVITVRYPLPPASAKVEVCAVTWKSREEIPVTFTYGSPSEPAPEAAAPATPPAAPATPAAPAVESPATPAAPETPAPAKPAEAAPFGDPSL